MHAKKHIGIFNVMQSRIHVAVTARSKVNKLELWGRAQLEATRAPQLRLKIQFRG